MSIKWMTTVWKLQGLYQSEKFVLLALADNANNDGVCWPSIPDISERCVLSERQTLRIIESLHQRGLLNKEIRSGKSTIYTLVTPDTHVTPDKLSPLTFATHTPDTHVTPTPDICDITYIEEPSFESSLEEPSKEKLKKQNNLFSEKIIPEWLGKELWKAFSDMRKKIKKPMTERAEILIIKKLDDFRKQGHSPQTIIEQSIINGWQDVYIPKNTTPTASNSFDEWINRPENRMPSPAGG